MPSSWSSAGLSSRGVISVYVGMRREPPARRMLRSISLNVEPIEGEGMAYQLPDLAYAFDALEPHIDATTMEIHHDKHHAAYVTNLNAALDGTEWMDRPIEAVLSNLEILPADKQAAVRNNGGGHANHTLFWETLSPNGGGEPTGALGEAVGATF